MQPPCPALPAAADVAAFLATERGRVRSVNTLGLRRAAVRYLYLIAGLPVPTAEAQVAEALAGMQRDAAALGELSAKNRRPFGCSRAERCHGNRCHPFFPDAERVRAP